MLDIDYIAASSTTVGAALTKTQTMFPSVEPGARLVVERLRGGRRRVGIINQPPFPSQVESDSFMIGILLGRVRLFARRPPELPGSN